MNHFHNMSPNLGAQPLSAYIVSCSSYISKSILPKITGQETMALVSSVAYDSTLRLSACPAVRHLACCVLAKSTVAVRPRSKPTESPYYKAALHTSDHPLGIDVLRLELYMKPLPFLASLSNNQPLHNPCRPLNTERIQLSLGSFATNVLNFALPKGSSP